MVESTSRDGGGYQQIFSAVSSMSPLGATRTHRNAFPYVYWHSARQKKRRLGRDIFGSLRARFIAFSRDPRRGDLMRLQLNTMRWVQLVSSCLPRRSRQPPCDRCTLLLSLLHLYTFQKMKPVLQCLNMEHMPYKDENPIRSETSCSIPHLVQPMVYYEVS